MPEKDIILVGGGTLGPVTPLLAIAEVIEGKNVRWIGTYNGPERIIVEAAGIPFTTISSGKWRRYFSPKNIVDVFKIFWGFLQSLALLKKISPSVVVSAGGFVAVPVVWAAWLLRIPVHVHAQDIRPGLANKLSMPFATSVSVSFEKSLEDFKAKHPVWTGNPVRKSILSGSREKARELFGLQEGMSTVLVLGGGTGAATLNALTQEMFAYLDTSIQVLHVTGKGKSATTALTDERYHSVALIIKDMGHAYAAADVVVTRAGIGTLTELSALGASVIIAPMPGSHQEENATFFSEKKVALQIDESTISPEGFAKLIADTLNDQEQIMEMSTHMRSLTKEDAANAVKELIFKAGESRQA